MDSFMDHDEDGQALNILPQSSCVMEKMNIKILFLKFY
jgi:hypothetical protein